MRKTLIKLAQRLERSWRPVDLSRTKSPLDGGWYVSEFVLQGAIQATPRIIVRDSSGVDRERLLTGCHSGRNRMLFFLPDGHLQAHSQSINFEHLSRVSTLEGRARVLLICFRYLIDFFSPVVLLRMIAMQFQNNWALCDELLQFYSPRQESYLQNVDRWTRFRGYGKPLGWWYRNISIAVLIEDEGQRPALLDLLVPPEVILLAADTNKLPANVDYVIPLARSESLRFPALLILKRAIHRQEVSPNLIYTDHDYPASSDAKELAADPVFKAGPSEVYQYCFDYIGPAVMYAADALQDVDLQNLCNDETRYHLNLRLLRQRQRVLHVDEVLFASSRELPPQTPAPASGLTPWPHIRWQRAQSANILVVDEEWQEHPSVDLVVPTRDGLDVLQPCVDSILTGTDYSNYHLYIVDNDSQLPETRRYFQQLDQDSRVTILSFPGEFNFSAINNFAVRHGDGDYIGLINNDIEAINRDWLKQMMVWAKQDNVGAVGAKLLFGDGRVQHAGVTIGMGNAAGHIHRLEQGDAPGYQHRCLATQNMMAVTAACMITPRKVYESMGGLNEHQFAVAYNDIDYCLRVEASGMDIIWTPEARLFHHESVSRGDDMSQQHIERYFAELAELQKRWKTKGFVDKYYSRHLRISDEGVYPQVVRQTRDILVEPGV